MIAIEMDPSIHMQIILLGEETIDLFLLKKQNKRKK